MTWGAAFDASLPMIRYLDADMRISANRVTLKDYVFGQGGATITAQAGKLHADIAELEVLSGGTLTAQVTAHHDRGRTALRPARQGRQHGDGTGQRQAPGLARAHRAREPHPGPHEHGLFAERATRRLSGKAALSMPEGGRVALDLKAVRKAAKAGARGWAALAKSHTNVERLEARSLIIDGVAFAEDIQARAGDLGLVLAGRFGLVDGNIDARLVLKPGAASDASAKPADAVSEAVTLRGPWPDPVLRGDDSEAVGRSAP